MYPNQNQFQAPPPGQLDGVLGEIESAEHINGDRVPRLAIGQHTLILTYFGGRNSTTGLGTILESEYLVEKSTCHAQGEKRGWQFFPGLPQWAGAHEKSRVQDYMKTVDASLGEPVRGTKTTGGELASGSLRGMRFEVTVRAAVKKDGTPRLNKKGEPVTNAFWSPVMQAREQIKALNAQLPAEPPRAIQQAPQQGYAPQQQYQQAPAPQYAPQSQYQQQPQQQQPAPQQMQSYPQQGYAPQPNMQPYAPPAAPPAQPAAPLAAPQGSPNPLAAIIAGLR